MTVQESPDLDITRYARLGLYFDGSCEPNNPGGWGTYGWCILDPQGGEELVTGHGIASEPGPDSTNNRSEYTALGTALRWLADRGWRGKLEVFGDSQLVVHQVTGRWQCRKGHLLKLRDRVRELLTALGGDYAVNWIPRDLNDRCDGLARRAYTEATGLPFPERR